MKNSQDKQKELGESTQKLSEEREEIVEMARRIYYTYTTPLLGVEEPTPTAVSPHSTCDKEDGLNTKPVCDECAHYDGEFMRCKVFRNIPLLHSNSFLAERCPEFKPRGRDSEEAA